MNTLKYVSVDRVLSKFHRDLKGTELVEDDAIEMIGEALEHLQVASVQEEAIAFMEVKNHEVSVPCNLHTILQIGKSNDWTEEDKCTSPENILKECPAYQAEGCYEDCNTNYVNDLGYPIPLHEDGSPVTDYDVAYYRPFFDQVWEYKMWNNVSDNLGFTPVRLANHTFFNSIVCKEKDNKGLYSGCIDEYTIVGTTEKKLRFSFESGFVAVSYLRNATDNESGYPLIPDEVSYITAITYYIQWKLAEWRFWNNREGAAKQVEYTEDRWLKYARQAKNKAKMPKSIDQYQNLLEQSHQMIPNHKKYYGFFGNLGREQSKKYNDPDSRRRAY